MFGSISSAMIQHFPNKMAVYTWTANTPTANGIPNHPVHRHRLLTRYRNAETMICRLTYRIWLRARATRLWEIYRTDRRCTESRTAPSNRWSSPSFWNEAMPFPFFFLVRCCHFSFVSNRHLSRNGDSVTCNVCVRGDIKLIIYLRLTRNGLRAPR